ncbi:MAG: hypothetical protein A2166_04320 [Omnitrophica WOR_2 bacterium RBG_13_41_10]|nr:MAG: hypothetical protein A2166_04320 [Omnitrophica WOR_2 bacterium RBG_13_41_10]
MNLAFFSLKVGFTPLGPPKVFRIFGSCATRPPQIVGGRPPKQCGGRPSALSRQDGLKHARRPNVSTFGVPKILKLLWLKPPFARNNARFIFKYFN